MPIKPITFFPTGKASAAARLYIVALPSGHSRLVHRRIFSSTRACQILSSEDLDLEFSNANNLY